MPGLDADGVALDLREEGGAGFVNALGLRLGVEFAGGEAGGVGQGVVLGLAEGEAAGRGRQAARAGGRRDGLHGGTRGADGRVPVGGRSIARVARVEAGGREEEESAEEGSKHARSRLVFQAAWAGSGTGEGAALGGVRCFSRRPWTSRNAAGTIKTVNTTDTARPPMIERANGA